MTKKWYQMKEQAAGEKRLMFLWYVYRIFGKRIVQFFTIFVAFFAFVLSKDVRKYAKINLSVIYEYCKKKSLKTTKPDIFNRFKTVLNYALSLVDKMETFCGDFDVKRLCFANADAADAMRKYVAQKKGMFFICSHTGLIDVMRIYTIKGFENLDREIFVNVFLSESQSQIFNNFIKNISVKSTVRTYPVENIDMETSVEIQENLNNGELAFMAGDRLSPGSSHLSFSAELFGQRVEFPAGTFRFAQLMGVPVFFIAAVKGKKGVYNVYMHRFEFSGTKKETIKAMQNEYVEFVQKVSSMYPTQFYHFYPLFGEKNINI